MSTVKKYSIDGRETYEYAESNKHDIECMKKCCNVELTKTEQECYAPAPYYFERVAILSRKEKNYTQEIEYCEKYALAIDDFRKKYGDPGANIALGAFYLSIPSRIDKAKKLLQGGKKTRKHPR